MVMAFSLSSHITLKSSQSTTTMGASVGVFLDQMTPDLKEAIELAEKQKYTIAEYDAAMLDREMSKVFKKHGKIIKTLTSRTKAQLKRTLTVKNRVPDDIYRIVGGNNNYAMFMKQLHMSKHEIEMENLKASSKTELYDEELLINIVGTSTNKELKAFCELYARDKGTSLSDVFVAKTKPDSQLQRFIALCWKFDRDEGKTIDEKLAAQQAADIHKAGAARLLGCDEDLIFKILTTNSRAQCAAIADQYLTQFNMKFERAINMKFKGNCSKLMLLWALPIPTAIITCIHSYEERMIIDKVAIMSMVSKYDKDVLAQVDIAAEKTYEKNLLGIVQRGLSGNLLKAVQEWIENASPDKGYERVTELFLENQQSFGRTLEELLKNSEFQQRLLFLVKKDNEEVERYMKDNRIKFNPHDKLDLRALGSIGTMDSFDAHHSVDSKKDGSVINKYSVKQPEERATTEYDKKYKALQNYFKSFFSGYDKKNVGIFDEKEFWSIMKELPLETLGLTEHEVDSMAEFSEWVLDGKVNYHEAIFELSDSVITFIESKRSGESDVLAVVAELTKDEALGKGKSERKIARHESVEEISDVPDYFLQYIYDTFYAYDFDNNGYLCQAELDAVLPVLNIGMTHADFLRGNVRLFISLLLSCAFYMMLDVGCGV
jgi:Ca2+-binding EF-hand superfamily protein